MPQSLPSFLIGIPIYQGVDLLDVAAPCEMFSWLKSSVEKTMTVDVRVVAATCDRLKTRDGLHLFPDQTFAETPRLDLLWVPGGDLGPLKRTMKDKTYLNFLRTRSRTATYVVSVCEGAMLLGSAGLLAGHKVTTHWAFIPCLKRFARVRPARGFPRFVISKLRRARGKKRFLVTGGGVSSGLDEALQLIKMIAGAKVAEGVQLSTQYYPCPPVDGEITPATDCPLDSAS
jgi:transcriptional regulator GlxA family with amidase domain